MLDRVKHEQILKNILRDIYITPNLQSSVAFKGGTCLYMFYNLDRFSVDLDFNLLSAELDYDLVTNIVSRYLQIEDNFDKRFTGFWMGSYEKGKQKIKVEISKRDYPDKYINKDFYGLTIPIMSPSYMFAHKLCAITDRKVLQNRDLYDANFMFTKGFEINKDIINLRTGQSVADYLKTLINFIEERRKTINILEGLGELVSDSQKDQIKATLIRDLLVNLNLNLVSNS